MKRKLNASVLCIIVMALLVINGCTKDNNGGQAVNNSNSTAEPAASADKPVDLSIGLSSSMDYNNYAKKNDKTDWPAIKEMEKQANVNIDFKIYPVQDADTLMNTQLAAGGDLPDIMLTSDAVKTNVLLQNGITVDLLPLIKKYAPNMQALMDKYPEIMATHTLEDGRMFSFPKSIMYPTDNLPSVMLRQDWMKKLNLQEPTTVDEFTDVLRAFRDKDPNGDGKQDEVPLVGRFWYFINYLKSGFGLYDSANGGDSYFFPDENGQFQLQLARPEYKAFVTWVHTLYEENLIDHKMFEPGDQEANSTALMNSANLGGVVWWSNSVRKGFTDYLVKSAPDAQLVVVTPPKSEFVDKVQVQRVNPMLGQAIITRNAKDPVAAIKFMDYGFSDEGVQLAQWGIEGDSYNVKDGKKVITDKLIMDKPDPNWYLPEAYGLHYWLSVADFSIYGQLANWQQIDYDSNDKMKSIATAPIFPALKYTDDESMLYDQLRPDITTYGDENILKFITGTRPLSEWDSFVKDMETKFKSQELIDKVYQPAYERYQEQLNAGK